MEHDAGKEVQITICVKNTGGCRGKEVGNKVYDAGTAGKTWKPARELKAFAKTKEHGSGRKTENDTAHSGEKILLHMMIPVWQATSPAMYQRQVLTYSMWVIVCGIRKSQMWMEKEHIS